MPRLGIFAIAVACGLPAFAQIGPFPGGGGYPQTGPFPGGGGGYPQSGPGLPIPWPRKGKHGGDTNKTAAVTRHSGRLRRVDDKTVEIETSDSRVLSYRRNSKTLFYGLDGKEAAASKLKLKPGDQVSVESTEDDRGYLFAQKVFLDKEGTAADKERPAGDKAGEGGGDTAEVEYKPSPIPPDPDDPGPPELRRGVPPKESEPSRKAEVPQESAPPARTETAAVREPAPERSAAEPPAEPSADPVIEKARQAAATFSQGLPDYVCQEFMARYQSGDRPSDWQAQDIVSADVLYRGGHEDYRNVAVNGKPAHKNMDQLDGSWSTGEFASELLDLFSPSTRAEFHYRRDSFASGTAARVYDFAVAQPHSHWHVQMASQSIQPAYKGSVWIDPKSGHVLRIEMQATALPGEFPMDTVESAVDYANIRIGEGQFYLPTHAENLGCERGTRSCSKNAIDFRNYHKYEANSSITFGTP